MPLSTSSSFASRSVIVFGLIDLHRMDVVRHHPRRAGAADGGDVEDGAVLDRLDLRRELVLVAVFLEIAVELNGFEEAVPLRTDLIDRDILRPAEMGVDAFEVLGSECDFHGISCSGSAVNGTWLRVARAERCGAVGAGRQVSGVG